MDSPKTKRIVLKVHSDSITQPKLIRNKSLRDALCVTSGLKIYLRLSRSNAVFISVEKVALGHLFLDHVI